jgi:L-iditol 2-dehydrogenase
MKALMLTEYNHLEYMDVPEPDLDEDGVLVQVKACGICGSDIHGIDGSSGRRIPPIIMGHEAAGVIARTGSRVTAWREGDRVTFDSTIFCGECYYCRHGLINLCDQRRVLGVSCQDYRQHGAFAEYVAVPQRILYHLPDEVSFTHGATVEPVSVAVHAASLSPIALDDTAVVVGSGMIGLLVIQTLRAAGCGCIIAVDLDPYRLEQALGLGADIALNSDQHDVVTEVHKLTSGRGADIAFEVVGISPTVKLAIQTLRKGGALTLIGNLSPTVELPLQAAVTRQLTLLGSAASCGEYPACLNIIARGNINLEALISAVAPLSEGGAWFKRLYDGQEKLLKVILEPGA